MAGKSIIKLCRAEFALGPNVIELRVNDDYEIAVHGLWRHTHQKRVENLHQARKFAELIVSECSDYLDHDEAAIAVKEITALIRDLLASND